MYLRETIPDFDEQLVDLATGTRTLDVNDRVSNFYNKQCRLFGLDPELFRPFE